MKLATPGLPADQTDRTADATAPQLERDGAQSVPAPEGHFCDTGTWDDAGEWSDAA